jgi:uncharacterized damage-inducible protein DinB
MTAAATPTTAIAIPSPKEQFLQAFTAETATTLKVLRAYPKDASELRPHERLKTARELCWIFTIEQAMAATAVTTGFDWSKPAPMPPAPATFDEVIAAFEQGVTQLKTIVSGLRDEQLLETVQFPTGTGKIGDHTKVAFLWFTLCDQIHHRGQLSIYLRIAGGKLPSIYGPTADEPWF